MKLKNKTLDTMVKFMLPYKFQIGILILFMIGVAIIDGLFPY